MNPIAKTKHSELIDKMNKLVENKANDIELARLRAEIKKIEAKGLYGQAQELKGMYSAIVGDAKSVEKHYQAALGYSGEEPALLYSYMISLNIVMYNIEASKIGRKVLELIPDDVGILRNLLRTFQNTGDLEGAKKTLTKLKLIGISDDDVKIKESIDSIEYKRKFLSDNNLSWKEISERTLLVAEDLFAKNIKISAVLETIYDETLFIEFLLPLEKDELLDADFAITEKISNSPFTDLDNHLSISCISSFGHQLNT